MDSRKPRNNIEEITTSASYEDIIRSLVKKGSFNPWHLIYFVQDTWDGTLYAVQKKR